jgi:hypothetical protein
MKTSGGVKSSRLAKAPHLAQRPTLNGSNYSFLLFVFGLALAIYPPAREGENCLGRPKPSEHQKKGVFSSAATQFQTLLDFATRQIHTAQFTDFSVRDSVDFPHFVKEFH